MNKEQLEQQIKFCDKEINELNFRALSLLRFKEFLESELMALDLNK